jgi:hypothetical protein
MIRQSINKGDRRMKKIVSLAAVVTMLAVASSAANAGGHGVSGSSPGQQFRTNGIQQNGPTAGYPGASGYAPGRLYQSGAPTTATGSGASVYAPGFLR